MPSPADANTQDRPLWFVRSSHDKQGLHDVRFFINVAAPALRDENGNVVKDEHGQIRRERIVDALVLADTNTYSAWPKFKKMAQSVGITPVCAMSTHVQHGDHSCPAIMVVATAEGFKSLNRLLRQIPAGESVMQAGSLIQAGALNGLAVVLDPWQKGSRPVANLLAQAYQTHSGQLFISATPMSPATEQPTSSYPKPFKPLSTRLALFGRNYDDAWDIKNRATAAKAHRGQNTFDKASGYVHMPDGSEDARPLHFTPREQCFPGEPGAANARSLVETAASIQTQAKSPWYLPSEKLATLPAGVKDCNQLLRQKAEHWLSEHFNSMSEQGIPDDYLQRLDMELGVIAERGFSSYFLVLADTAHALNAAGIPNGIRGSAVGSLVAYATGLSSIDPIRYDLPFERFLNSTRASAPDIDLEITPEGLVFVDALLSRQYGRSNVCHIALQTGTGVKKACEMVLLENGFTKDDFVSPKDGHNPENAKSQIPGLFAEIKNVSQIKDTREKTVALRELFKEFLEGRSIGDNIITKETADRLARDVASIMDSVETQGWLTAGKVILPDEHLDDFPLRQLTPDGKHRLSTGLLLDKESAASLGAVKIDFLSSQQRLAQQICTQLCGLTMDDIHPDRLGGKDVASALAFIFKGDNYKNIFQLENYGDRIKKATPESFGELASALSLIRPGCTDFFSGTRGVEKVIDTYARRKGLNMDRLKQQIGKVMPNAPQECVETIAQILLPTRGIVVFQEQIMKMAQLLGGLSAGDSDNFRRAADKEDQQKIEELHQKFLENTKLPQDVAEDLFARMLRIATPERLSGGETSSNYTFGKSHSFGYAQLTLQGAWLKANHPEQWAAACTVCGFRAASEASPQMLEQARKLKTGIEEKAKLWAYAINNGALDHHGTTYNGQQNTPVAPGAAPIEKAPAAPKRAATPRVVD